MGFIKTFNEILDIVFPRKCDACGAINFGGEFRSLCPKCAEDIYLTTKGRCLICSEIVADRDVEGCAKCAENPPYFSHSRTICIYGGSGKVLAESLKYHSDIRVTKDIAALARKVPDLEDFLRNSTLVPVPLYWKRQISRGYNQAELICDALAIRAFPSAKIEVVKLLKRVRNTKTQTALEKDSREKNIRGAFALTHMEKKFDKDKRIVIVDDVMTTTSTLSECARTLKKFGFKNVDAFAFARRI